MHPDFHPAVRRWFETALGEPTRPQARGWPAIRSGADTLIAAPTGSGKTLAAFLAALDDLVRRGLAGDLRSETSVVYVSPLKALSNDVHKNLLVPLAGIRAALEELGLPAVEIEAAVRTGDTPAARRQALARRPPHVLVTTPESLYLLLTAESGRRMLRLARTVIVDEIHALAGNRRGAHLALSLERLDALCGRRLQRVGLSATVRPIDEVARFLTGAGGLEGDGSDAGGQPRCAIIDEGHARDIDLAIEVPRSPLEAVMSGEVWTEVYGRLADLIASHRTTLVFVNTRRLSERVTRHLAEKLGEAAVASHHGSLAARLRLEAEDRLKRGKLRALVATSSLELGIDVGAVDLVCQIGSTRSIAALLQRAGRAGHSLGALPKGRLFPLSRDELVECAALLAAVRRGVLDRLEVPPQPLDILAQQVVAAAACEEWKTDELHELARRAYPYRRLARAEFDEIVDLLAHGVKTRRGRRGAHVFHDAVGGRIRGRRGARLTALTSGGAIPENADYTVLLEPEGTYLGTVNEDFAIESIAGDIFQLGNASWRIVRVERGAVRVEDARGKPPNIPFWLGEAPARTAELSREVSRLRAGCARRLADPGGGPEAAAAWLEAEVGLERAAAEQVAAYLDAGRRALGTVPTQDEIVIERFFDELGGTQVVLHAPFGSRLLRAWGLALRKRFCRTFNFELQAAANEEAVLLSLGAEQSFALDEVPRFLSPTTARDVLVQALLDAPMFTTRWRWNASRALLIPRQRNGKKVPAPLQRFQAEDLIAAVFPEQLACLENIAGDREVPDHPLVRQTIDDCLHEAMDIDGLVRLLGDLAGGRVRCVTRDATEPSVLSHEILNAKPYAFLDDAPLEERRAQAVYTRRALEAPADDELGLLDPGALERVLAEARPPAGTADELHDALLLAGALTEEEASRGENDAVRATEGESRVAPAQLLEELAAARRAGVLFPRPEAAPPRLWVAAERLALLARIYPGAVLEPPLEAPAAAGAESWTRAGALQELLRSRLETSGPVTASEAAAALALGVEEVEGALGELEREGAVLRGAFTAGETRQWFDRRLLARVQRLTLERLRAEIEPVAAADFYRFLLAWQRLAPREKLRGLGGVAAAVDLLDGFELAAGSWEPDVLAARVEDYDPLWLDQLCLSGQVGWGRLSPPAAANGGGSRSGPLRTSPVALFRRGSSAAWHGPEAAGNGSPSPTAAAGQVLAALEKRGASFFADLVSESGLLPTQVEAALGELVALGKVTADSFAGLRALLLPAAKRPRPGRRNGRDAEPRAPRRRRSTLPGIESAGRWSLLPAAVGAAPAPAAGAAVEVQARALLRRYGVVCRRLLERESRAAPWRDLLRAYRRLEARGEVRGGRFVSSFTGEQFALAEVVGLLRAERRRDRSGETVVLSGADPLNLAGIITPGERVPAVGKNRLLIRDGVPLAALVGGAVRPLAAEALEEIDLLESRLRRGKLPPLLRPYV